jgi:peptidoglycan-associated lipoprotein
MIKNKLLLTLTLSSLVTLAGCATSTTEDAAGDETSTTAPVEATETAATTEEAASTNESTISVAAPEETSVVEETVEVAEVVESTVEESTEVAVEAPVEAADIVAAMPDAMVILFEFDRSEVRREYKEIVAAHASYLVANPDMKVRLEGHADERGSVEYNIGLGARRAEAVSTMLKLLGISGDRITTRSFGESRPAVRGSNEIAYSENRRVEFKYF